MLELESPTSWAYALGAIAALALAGHYLIKYRRHQAETRRDRAIEAARLRDAQKWEEIMARRGQDTNPSGAADVPKPKPDRPTPRLSG